MKKLAAWVFAALPLVVAAQDAAQPSAEPVPPRQAEPPAAPHAQAPPQYPPTYTPPPQYTPAPPPEPYAPPPQYQPPPGQYAAPPQYAPPPQHAPPAQYGPPAPYPPPPVQPYRRPERQRDTWYIGFGLGGGDGNVHFTGDTVKFRDMVAPGRTTVALNFRAGATLTPKLLLGFDGGAVAAASEEDGFTSSVQVSYYDVGVMYFPAERGFFLRAATGLSSFVWDIESIGETSARGVNVLGGVGYAFWLGRTFNLTLNADVQRHWFDEGDLEGATAWGLWLGFDWY